MPKKHLQIAAYARVSTNLPSQENSLLSQESHWKEIVSAHRDWELYDLYIEKGVTGTSTDQRPELKRLIVDCIAGKVDLVLTKSISRFARNVFDCLNICRRLKKIGVAVYFEKENIRTDTEDGELMLTLFATVAEEESRSIQTNSQWSVQKRMAAGTFKFSKAPFGYRLSPKGRYVVEPSTAPVVREIFEMATNGMGTPTIARNLAGRGVSTGTRRRDGSAGEWNSSMVRGILKNTVYKGDLLMQKTFTDRNYRTRQNNGERDQYFVHDEALAIITPDLWERANEALRARRTGTPSVAASMDTAFEEEVNSDREAGENREAEQSNYSGKLRCVLCGHNYKHVVKGGVDWWACQGKLKDRSRCSALNLREEDITALFFTMLNKLRFLADAVPTSNSAVGKMLEMLTRPMEDDLNLFPDLISHIDVAPDRLIFHLKCGLTLTESTISEEQNGQPSP